MDSNKNYYVYIWIREDYNTIFYVGKGKNNRAKIVKGNIHFKRIYEKVPTHYELIYTDLTEKEAFDLEKETIHKLVYEDGYSIQARAYEGKETKGRHLVNCTFGGEGVSGHKHTPEENAKSVRLGEQNGNYGKRGELHQCYGVPKTEEHKSKIRCSNPRSKKVYCIELNESFDSARQASDKILIEHNIVVYHSAISKCCQGLRDSCGYHKDTREKVNLHFIYSPTTTERVDANQLTD